MLALLGLKDSYIHDGRVLAEWLEEHTVPGALHQNTFLDLARVLKQINAPLGSIGRNSLVWANRSITGSDATYTTYLARIADITQARDELTGQIKLLLDGAAFKNQPIDERQQDDLVRRAGRLVDQVEDLAGGRARAGH
jgi:hypothetical protein